MGSVVRYTLLRLSLLVAIGLVAYAVGARGIALVVIAFIGSGVVSLFVLRAPREDVARKLADRADPSRPRRGPLARINQRIEAANRAEDEALDAEAAATNQSGDDAEGEPDAHGDTPRS